MGMLLNPGNTGFASSLSSSIYVDKTELIECTNHVLGTEQRFMCVSRPRRFGKSMAAKMLAAYYSQGCDSFELFKNLKIANSPAFEKELNKHPLIYLDVQWFLSVSRDKGNVEQTVSYIQNEVIKELARQYLDIVKPDDISLSEVLFRIHSRIGEQFVIIIDEWDCLFREEKNDTRLQENYINFLRGIFKGILA